MEEKQMKRRIILVLTRLKQPTYIPTKVVGHAPAHATAEDEPQTIEEPFVSTDQTCSALDSLWPIMLDHGVLDGVSLFLLLCTLLGHISTLSKRLEEGLGFALLIGIGIWAAAHAYVAVQVMLSGDAIMKVIAEDLRIYRIGCMLGLAGSTLGCLWLIPILCMAGIKLIIGWSICYTLIVVVLYTRWYRRRIRAH